MIEKIECRLALNETCIEAPVLKPMSFEIDGETVYLISEQDEECRKCPRSVQMPGLMKTMAAFAFVSLLMFECIYQM